jgi:hypothetical protein
MNVQEYATRQKAQNTSAEYRSFNTLCTLFAGWRQVIETACSARSLDEHDHFGASTKVAINPRFIRDTAPFGNSSERSWSFVCLRNCHESNAGRFVPTAAVFPTLSANPATASESV